MDSWSELITAYAYLGLIAGCSFVVLKGCHYILLARLHSLAGRTKSGLDDILVRALKKINWSFLLALSLWLASKYTTLPLLVNKILDGLIIVLSAGTVIAVLSALLRETLNRHLGKNEHSRSLARLSAIVVNVIFWLLAMFFVLSSLGINISSLVTGLGVSGIIIAFALQNVLTDLFSSLTIYIDRPFKEGDFIINGVNQGWVRKIGFKTTRLEALTGQELILPNKDLTNATVENFKDLKKRRVGFNLSLAYNTGSVKCREALKIIKAAISSTEYALFDQAHFTTFGDSALIYQVIYYVDGADYKRYLDVQQNINFKIKRSFEQAGIAMAYPTQTIYLEKN